MDNISDTGVVYIKQTAQRFLKNNKQQFDVIVNDMKTVLERQQH